MKWEIAKLGDISKNIQTGPFGSQLHQSDYSECGIPVVMPKDLVGGKISEESIATVYKGNIIKNLIMDCQSYTKYRPNETTGGIFVSWRRKEELPTGA